MSDTRPPDGARVGEVCAGTGRPATDGTVLQEGATKKTGVCPLCGGRFRLGSEARLVDHSAAPDAER